MPLRRLALALCVVATTAAALPAYADPAADRAAIAGRLQRWAAAFNARDAAGVCDLFAPDLVSTVPGALNGSRDAVCARLRALLSEPDLHLHYSLDIREIVVSGDIAAVRLFWTLTAQRGSDREVSVEAGMDLFARQHDGAWSLARFLAFTVKGDVEP